jgi:hypothetical protein
MANLYKAVVVLVILALPTAVLAVPAPVWSSSLEDATSITSTGGSIVGTPTYPAGYSGNAFGGTGSAYGVWNNTTVAGIFDGVWDNAAGSTIDLYFKGDHWSTHSGDSGLFAIYDRLGGPDGYYILQVQNGKLRVPYRNDAGTNQAVTYLAPSRLSDNVLYHLTVRQKDTALEIYLDDIGGNTYAPDSLYATVATNATYVFPSPNATNGSVLVANQGGRVMTVGLKPYPSSGTTYLQSGEWVDEVKVYNGYYAPSELVPEPASLMLLAMGGVALLRRQRGC